MKNVFSMTTKCLDQIGRAGAFHHIVRRTATMSDTALYELDDALEFSNLPLSGEGVFWPGLENLLKTRKEKKKQIEDLVPDFQKKTTKQKAESPVMSFDHKRPCYDRTLVSGSYTNSYSNSSFSSDNKVKPRGFNNFRIPRLPREQQP